MGGRRRLQAGLLRGYRDHRRVEALAYRRYVLAMLARTGPLDAAGMVTVREAGLTSAELGRLALEVEDLRDRPKRRRDLARLQRRRLALRSQLVALEKRLEELAASQPKPSLADYLAQQARTR